MALLPPQQPPQQQTPQGRTDAADRVTAQVEQFIYSDQGLDIIEQAFRSGAGPEVVPTIVARIFQNFMESAQQAGKQLPPHIVAIAMMKITQAVLELASDAGMIPEEAVEQMGPDMFMESARVLDQGMGDKMPEKERAAYGSLFEHLSRGRK